MPTIVLPEKFGFSRVERLQLTRGGLTMRSRYTGQAQRIIYPFAVWEFEGNLVDYPEDQGGREIRAFLAALEGQKNNFKLPVPGYKTPSSGYGANMAINVAAAARAMSVQVGGLPVGTTPLKAGEYITIQDELKLLTADAVVNGAGNATLTFQPPLRSAAANGTAVITQNPYVLLIASDNEAARWSLQAPVRYGFKLEAIEDL